MADPQRATTRDGTRPSDHHNAIDGLRGFAYLWVVAGHFWLIIPHQASAQIPIVGWMMQVGNRGVSVFLVLGGFFAARSLLAYRDQRAVARSTRWLARRILRVTLAIIPLLAAIIALALWERPPPFEGKDVAGSVISILTHSWTWFVQQHVFTAVTDLGHLWYLSVYVQAIVLLWAAFLVTGGRRRILIPLLIVAIGYVTWARSIAVEQHGELYALASTVTRIDGILWGALLGLALPTLRRRGRWIEVAGAAALVMMLVLASRSTYENYFQWPGVLNNVVICVLLASCWLSHGPLLTTIFASRFATEIGRRSLTIYVWHFPLFWLINRHTAHWSHTERAVVAIAALAAVVEFVHRQWDEPMRVWISRRFSSRSTA